MDQLANDGPAVLGQVLGRLARARPTQMLRCILAEHLELSDLVGGGC